jgi:hypothetical protein
VSAHFWARRSCESDITHLTENFEYIVSELEKLRGGGRGGDQKWIQELQSVGGVPYKGAALRVRAKLHALKELVDADETRV